MSTTFICRDLSGFLTLLLMWCYSFIFTLQRYSFFFIYARKTTIIFQKKCTFLCIFLAVRKSPYFYTLHIRTYNNKTTSWTHNNNMQHTNNTLPGNTTHNNNLNTWIHYTHTTDTQDNENTKQWEHIATWTPGQLETVHSAHNGHDGQGKENTRQRNENMHRQTNKRRHSQEKTHVYV